MILHCQKDQFSLEPGMHYLNCAYMSPLPKVVEEAGIRGLLRKRNPFKVSPSDYFEDAEKIRELFGQLVNAGKERIALVPSVSYAMGIVSRNIKAAKGKKIITVHEEFPSDVYALQRISREHDMELVIVNPPLEIKHRAKKWNERILEAIDSNTALINLSSVHWADGTIFDMEAIGKRAKEVGSLFVVDGTQSVGAMPFDLKKYNVDVLMCAGYKWLLGPYSTGLVYLGEYFDEGEPIEESWLNRVGSENFRTLSDYENTAAYKPGAARYNMGEYSNFINLPMLKASLTQVLHWTPAGINDYCRNLTGSFINHLLERGCWLEEDAFRSNHLFGCRLPAGVSLERVQAALSEKNVQVSFRGDVIRIAPHLYNDATDLEQLAAALLPD
jgi:selenocysteine lyase/cysteine desulfurase